MPIPFIHVGCGKFSLQRLQVLIDSKNFVPVACVDIDIHKARQNLSSSNRNSLNNLSDRVYASIKEAREKHDVEVCFIFAVASAHSQLVIESLELGMHTFCVKVLACNQEEFKKIMMVHHKNPELMLVQGLNNQWNQAAMKMREWLQSKNGIGEMLGGECICWGRQNIKTNPPQTDVTNEGMFFLALACHQLSQLVAAKGLPEYVTAYVHDRTELELDFRGVFGTSGGQCLLEYKGGVPFSYTGTRAGHGNPFGFASRWSGQWTIHGQKGDIRRVGGRLTLYRDGGPKEDHYLKDTSGDLMEDDRIQFDSFYDALKNKKNKKWLQQSSLDTWILMEACNESARKKEKININEFKRYLNGE
tara:strand:+ start:1030 stop:2109 length:1080 start_codon:yes stop_codon:yes gene_type:complete